MLRFRKLLRSYISGNKTIKGSKGSRSSDVYVSVTNKAGCWDAAVIGLTKENMPYWDDPNCPPIHL